MKLHYNADADTLNIDFSCKQCAKSFKIAPFILLYFDEQGDLIGMDIDRAKQLMDLSHLDVENLPLCGFSYRRG
ncbi:MAG: DUF2283 domain-containing protein [Candidatus Omnitrophota bacterium]|jgi:uncharacterized protein YuzE|nr:MAG: DUF2283 domain-containing protein [Candidatus Omnitrophota bacterium]